MVHLTRNFLIHLISDSSYSCRYAYSPGKMRKFLLSISVCFFSCAQVSSDNTIRIQPIVIVPHLKIFFGPPSPSTSKFPPIIELLVQRLQAQFSTYVYEDLSRPPTYEKPVYTLSPEEQATATEPLAEASTSNLGLNEINVKIPVNFTEEEEGAHEEGLIEENVVQPVQYGTLVVYLRKNSTLTGDPVQKMSSDGNKNTTGSKKSHVLTALLDIKLVVPEDQINRPGS